MAVGVLVRRILVAMPPARPGCPERVVAAGGWCLFPWIVFVRRLAVLVADEGVQVGG